MLQHRVPSSPSSFPSFPPPPFSGGWFELDNSPSEGGSAQACSYERRVVWHQVPVGRAARRNEDITPGTCCQRQDTAPLLSYSPRHLPLVHAEPSARDHGPYLIPTRGDAASVCGRVNDGLLHPPRGHEASGAHGAHGIIHGAVDGAAGDGF